jgi:hypothetical protein
MTSKKQKERKKKNRENIAKERVLKRRQTLQKQRKQAFEEQLKQKQAEHSVFGKQMPFFKNNANVLNKMVTEERKNEIKEKIERNLQILEALEQEYDQENSQRKQINEKLESEGHMTMKEKMDALHKKALQIEGKAEELEQAQKDYETQKDEIVVEPETVVEE